MRRRVFIVRTAAAGIAAAFLNPRDIAAERASQVGQLPANLLRNGDFQDDWLTQLPQNQTLHWAYANTFYNRRDFNPDGWTCTGSWQWLDADKPRSSRRLVLRSPSAQALQRIHWFAIHDERSVSGFPDAGGFPELRPLYSQAPERLVRDLTLRVRLRGEDVPSGAGGLELGLATLGNATTSDPLGSLVKPLVSSTVPFPGGTFGWQWLEARLPASEWLKAAAALPPDPARGAAPGRLLPSVISVLVRFEARAGQIELGAAELSDPGPGGPNLLPNSGFETVGADSYPAGWERPAKYGYFPPKHYYLFTTWHNALFPNRGRVETDELVTRTGTRSFKMIVPSGDEVFVASPVIRLNQREPRLIEVAAVVRTDRLCMLGIDGVDERGERLDGFSFIHKAPVSIGTDGWRLLRQVFRPRAPVASLRLMLCARGANGYTLDATGLQPQNNVVGTVWWDAIRVYEPESTPAELTARSVTPMSGEPTEISPHLEDLDLGERLFGLNGLTARVLNPKEAASFALRWEFTSPGEKQSKFDSPPVHVPAGGEAQLRVPYSLDEPCRAAYTEYRGRLTLVRNGRTLSGSNLWFSTWAVPIDLKLGSLYLRPEQVQFVRVNLGFSAATIAELALLRLEIVRRRTGRAIHSVDVPATPEALAAQRSRIPSGLRGDLASLLLADLDVSTLPVQPFSDPQRNWVVRVTALDRVGRSMASVQSEPFCRQAPEPPQPPIARVTIGRDNLLRVNDEPWMPWGGIYGFAPAYPGPTDPGKDGARDLRALPGWSMYDRFSGDLYTRRANDFNCARDVAGKITPRELIEKRWTEDNLYSSTAFAVPDAVFSTAELVAKAGGQAALDAYLNFCKRAPMVVATTPGIEEVFGLFHTATTSQLDGLRAVVEHLRRVTDKPVMVGHGGYWNRLEFEKVPYFQIYDPETEPLYPANLHTDLWPLVAGQEKVIWLRPQMYEDVPYERWRFHVYVELMRGCRGWQMAHGPGEASLMRGLHGEVEFMKPIVASADPGPPVRIEPWIEHWSRRYQGKTYIIAAATHGMAFGDWRPGGDSAPPAGRPRVTQAVAELQTLGAMFGLSDLARSSYGVHGVQYLPAVRAWLPGSRLVQWVRLDDKAARRGLAILVKADGRFMHAASWGRFDVSALRSDLLLPVWFLRTFYRHAIGFLGWKFEGLFAALDYIPNRAVDMGAAPAAGSWVRLEVELDRIGAAGKLLDGVGFIHSAGQIAWGRTSIIDPAGAEVEVWGDSLELPPDRLARTKISVGGVKAGTRVRVLFEDRELTAADGHFIDDFRGQDLYQRFGGGPRLGYGDAPVALHVYEVG
jgi:hypothetical protein